MDITIRIVFDPKMYPMTGAKEARRQKPGDIIEVMSRARAINPLLPTDRTAYIHVINVPDVVTIEQAVRRLGKLLLGPARGAIHINNERQVLRNNAWTVPLNLLPLSNQQDLQTTRGTMLDWSTARQLIRKKTIVEVMTPDSDDLSVELQSGDLLG